MKPRVCLSATTLGYPEGGGHAWVFLNWALGLRAAGAEVIWLETTGGGGAKAPDEKLLRRVAVLRERLAKFDLDRGLVVHLDSGSDAGCGESLAGCSGLEAALEADLLVNFHYWLNPAIVTQFRRSALVDLDPGITQTYVSRGDMRMTPHDFYFTIGETIGREGSVIPHLDLRWHYTAPAISLQAWPVVPAPTSALAAPFTAISHWQSDEFMPDQSGGWYRNDKRSGFEPFLDLPSKTNQPLELAIYINSDDPELSDLRRRGWRVRRSGEVSGNTASYQQYIQQSRGEFGCGKPAYVKLQTAWISDRTLCYLASGRPAVVQDTGPSRLLPDRSGLFRFRTIDDAAACIDAANFDYEKHSRAARALAEELFDARQVATRLLNVALN